MNTATADGGRALLGISRDGMTIKWLGKLNRFHVPGNGMTVDMLVNICFLLFIGNNFGILAASQPRLRARAHVRPVRVRAPAQGPAQLAETDQALGRSGYRSPGILAVWCLILTIVGFGWMQVAAGGYGGTEEKIIGVSRAR